MSQPIAGKWFLAQLQDRIERLDSSPEPIIHTGWNEKKVR